MHPLIQLSDFTKIPREQIAASVSLNMALLLIETPIRFGGLLYAINGMVQCSHVANRLHILISTSSLYIARFWVVRIDQANGMAITTQGSVYDNLCMDLNPPL